MDLSYSSCEPQQSKQDIGAVEEKSATGVCKLTMPEDPQELLAYLVNTFQAFVPDVKPVSEELDKFADSVDHHVRDIASIILEYPIASSIRETIQNSPWLYEQPEPLPPPPPPTLIQVGFLRWSANWLSRNRTAVAVTVAFFGTGALILWRRQSIRQARRKARRGRHGTRTEAVVLAGSAFSPLTKSLANDLERRNFIVYIPVCSDLEAQAVKDASSTDIRPLDLDITSDDITRAVQQFSNQFTTSSSPTRHPPLHLVALLTLPPLESVPASIQTITASDWSNAMNVKLIAPFTTVQAFLPLLQSQSSTLAFLTPSVISSLAPAGHAIESVIAGGLQRYINSLRRETSDSRLNIVEIKMGSFDYGEDANSAAEERNAAQSQIVPRSEIMAWNPLRRTRYVREQLGLRPKESKGTSLRQLHHNVFDAIVRQKGYNGTIFVGRGSRMYDVVGKWAPNGLVKWMLGRNAPAPAAHPPEGYESGNGSEGWEDVGR